MVTLPRIEGQIDQTGDAPLPNGNGVWADGVFSFDDNVVRENVISANAGFGWFNTVGGSFSNRNVFQGNFIGTNHDGTAPLGNGEFGFILTGSDNLIGGTGAGEGNVISANGGAGLTINDEDDGFGLTSRERQVLALVANGATNREIGAQLYMAEKTASVHVSRILSKLNVRSRTEAAAVAHRHRLN